VRSLISYFTRRDSVKILISHLTRMEKGYLCAAGIDIESGAQVRPVLEGKRLTSGLHARNGGPFDIGAVVDLGRTAPVGSPPAVEDLLFAPSDARRTHNVRASEFWSSIQSQTRTGLRDIFGPDLRTEGRTCVVDLGKGRASLGYLKSPLTPQLILDDSGKLRVLFSDGEFECSSSLTDIRFYEEDHATLRPGVFSWVSSRMSAGAILAVGLTRPYARPGEPKSYHWLQVNNIHLQAAPLWTSENANEGGEWSDEEDKRLAAAFRRGAAVADLATSFERQPAAIRSRLHSLGLCKDGG